jgi:ankyrin repeat protein
MTSSAMMFGDWDNILLNISPEEVNDFLGEYTWEGKWENVIMLYYEFPEQAQKAIISDSVGTALHVAIDLDEENVVKELVNAILTHNSQKEIIDERVEALEMQNERGDTPLHFAASRGFAKICKCIIGSNNERIYLLSRKNEHGETPLFQAAINWRKQTFAYLAHISKERVTLQDLVREDGDSILHTAIRGEYFGKSYYLYSFFVVVLVLFNLYITYRKTNKFCYFLSNRFGCDNSTLL